MTTFPLCRPRRGARRLLSLLVATLAAGLLTAGGAMAQVNGKGVALHGADAVFVTPEIAVLWAVLKQPMADKPDRAAVWLRIVNTARKFSHVAIDGVDPFSKQRQRVEKGVALAAEVRIEADRDGFADFTSREIHLYASDADWRADKPALTVYCLGVPDTTPEFSNREAMDRYLATAKLTPHAPGELKK